MSAWDDIIADFVEVLEVDAEPLLYHAFEHTPSGLDVMLLPEPKIDGAYSIGLGGISRVATEVNTVYWFVMDVVLKLGFTINNEAKADPNVASTTPVNDKADYAGAVKDIMLIIKTRLNPSTYEGVLDEVQFVSSTGLVFQQNNDNVAYCDITFRVTKQETTQTPP